MKRILCALLSALLLLTLTACGGKKPAEDPSVQPPVEQPDTPDTPDPPAPSEAEQARADLLESIRAAGAVLGWLPSTAFTVTGRLAQRYISRSKRRTSNTAAALFVGVAIVSCLGVVATSAKASVNSLVDTGLKADFAVSSASAGQIPDQAIKDIKKVDGVNHVVSNRVVLGVKYDGKAINGFTFATQPELFTKIFAAETTEGDAAAALKDGKLLVGKTIADDRGWHVGQKVKATAENIVVDKETTAKAQADYQGKVQAHVQELQSQAQQLAAQLLPNRTAAENYRAAAAARAALEQRWQWVSALAATAGGTLTSKQKIKLEAYIQMNYLDRILRHANTRLMQMTAGQYELERIGAENQRSQSGLDLGVIDHYNGTRRSVKTLSGGESFKASLALALGLSDEVQSSAGGIRLDTLFLDEGFGSQDEESLELAIRVLSGLTEGDRLVGIISHVGALKDRIDRQVVVHKARTGGSTVELRV